MPDRTINFGDDETEATYRVRDDDPVGGGDFILVEDLDGSIIPLKYNKPSGKLEAAVGIEGQTPTATADLTTKSYVDSVTQGLSYQEPVIDELNDPPASPSTGDRYLIDDNPTGDWSGNANEIAEWDGSQWVFDAPSEGWAVFIEDVDELKVYNGTNWVQFGSTLDHGALQGLADDDHTQYLLVDGSRSATGTIDAPSFSVDGNTLAQSVVFSGQETLSSGSAVVDTGISATDATFQLAIGVDDPDADTKLSGRLFWDDSAGTYKVEIVESDTSVGNPTANIDVVRVR